MTGKNERTSDEAIIRLFLDRDETAVRETDKAYGNYIYSIAFNILGDREDCLECKNDVYERIWNSVPPAVTVSFKAYIAEITRNLALNMYKGKNRQKRVSSEYSIHSDELEKLLRCPYTTEEEADADLLSKIISVFVRSLPERKRYIFISRFYCCDKVDDIASALKISRSMVNKELFKIKKSLKKILKKEGYDI